MERKTNPLNLKINHSSGVSTATNRGTEPSSSSTAAWQVLRKKSPSKLSLKKPLYKTDSGYSSSEVKKRSLVIQGVSQQSKRKKDSPDDEMKTYYFKHPSDVDDNEPLVCNTQGSILDELFPKNSQYDAFKEFMEAKPDSLSQKASTAKSQRSSKARKTNVLVPKNSFELQTYSNEIDKVFDKVETTICELGPDNKENMNNSVADASSVNLDGIDWNNESIVTGAIINMSLQEEANKSFGSIIKKALIENAGKTATQQVTVNTTFFESQATFVSLGGFYGLPERVKELLKRYKGIDELYDWQDECLRLPAVDNRKNLIYALPTSGGKTLVAEILMFRELLCRKRNAIFVLPYVAIVQEKVWSLSSFAIALDFLVEEYASSKGTYPPRKRRRKNSVYIATIEKALGLFNSLYETGRINEIGLVVVDELHLLGEKGRGATLEALLTKLMHIKEDIHIVGMSATIGNLAEICRFLEADMYTRNFRPIELVEYVKCGDEIAKINWNVPEEEQLFTTTRTATFNYSEALKKVDPDCLGGLVMEVIPKDSCLIFCSTKKSCENVTMLLCRALSPTLKRHKTKDKSQLIAALTSESGSLCEILQKSLRIGVAYHHSGLTAEERRLIEEGFRTGIVSVICCTSTLAAGVNLPAKRVILRKPYIGMDFISLSRYKQMVGRAGRAGLGETGESILICEKADLPKIRKLFMSPMDEVVSNLHDDGAKGLRHLLLSCINLGVAQNRKELQIVAGKTLMAIQQQRFDINVKKLTDTAIKELFKLGALQNPEDVNKQDVSVNLDATIATQSDVSQSQTKPRISNTTKLVISKLGCAAIKGGLELSNAHILYEDLLKAQKDLVLLTDLHLLYLVIPYDIPIKPDFNVYYNIFCKLNAKERHTAKIIGLDESCSTKMLSNRLLKSVPERIVNRFFLTLILYDMWKGSEVFQVAEKFQVNRGLVQSLMTMSATFATNIVNFCEELAEFWSFVPLLKGMVQRLSHCCIKELLPLMELPAVKQNRAKQLYAAGYTTLQKIAKANPDDIVQSIEFMSRKVANQLIAAAKMLLLEKVENLREEAQDVLEDVERKDVTK